MLLLLNYLHKHKGMTGKVVTAASSTPRLGIMAEKFGLDVESVSYEADHAFANSTRPEVYDKEAAEDAWARVTKFFSENL